MRTELNFTPTNLLDLAKKYSLYAVDQAEGYVATGQTMLDGDYTGFRHTLVNDAQKVTNIIVKRQAKDGVNRAADFLVKPSLTSGDGTRAYFLPWDSRGAAVEMTIPPFAAGGDANANPPIFFTAVLSGCSIVFKGTADKPTIFHCGTAGGESGQPTQGDSNEFFRKMLREIREKGLGRSNRKVGTQVLSTDYMHTRAGGGTAPAHESEFSDALKEHYGGRLVIEGVNMWGTVFGFRTGTAWAFYLQENATISYRKLDDIVAAFVAKASTDKSLTMVDFDKLTPPQLDAAKVPVLQRARPALVTEVFPGAGVATVTDRWRTLMS
jgi:uncharacterized membrane protein